MITKAHGRKVKARVRQGMKAAAAMGSAWYDVAAQIKPLPGRAGLRRAIIVTDDCIRALVNRAPGRVVRHAIAQNAAHHRHSNGNAEHGGRISAWPRHGPACAGRYADIVDYERPTRRWRLTW